MQSVRTEPDNRGMAGNPYDEPLDLGDPPLEERVSEEPIRENETHTLTVSKVNHSGD